MFKQPKTPSDLPLWVYGTLRNERVVRAYLPETKFRMSGAILDGFEARVIDPAQRENPAVGPGAVEVDGGAAEGNLIYRLTDADYALLDFNEMHAGGYERVIVTVREQPNDKAVRAWFYKPLGSLAEMCLEEIWTLDANFGPDVVDMYIGERIPKVLEEFAASQSD